MAVVSCVSTGQHLRANARDEVGHFGIVQQLVVETQGTSLGADLFQLLDLQGPFLLAQAGIRAALAPEANVDASMLFKIGGEIRPEIG